MSEFYNYRKIVQTIDYTMFFYPENYWGEGWPDQIGPPETWGQYVGYSLRDRYTVPGDPWNGDDLDTLLWLTSQTYIPGRGPFYGFVSQEDYDPPPKKQFLQQAEFEYGWVQPYNIVFWSEYTWGRMNYRFTGTYYILEKRKVFIPCGSILPFVVPLFCALLPLLSGAIAVSGSGQNPTGRRRKV